MEFKVEETRFINAQTEDQKLAIQTCPGSDDAIKWALDHLYEDRRLGSHYRNCPRRFECLAEVNFTPHVNRLSIYGLCLMD